MGLKAVDFTLTESRPEYLRLSAPTYLVGVAYERLVNATDALRDLRILLMGDLEKPKASRTPSGSGGWTLTC